MNNMFNNNYIYLARRDRAPVLASLFNTNGKRFETTIKLPLNVGSLCVTIICVSIIFTDFICVHSKRIKYQRNFISGDRTMAFIKNKITNWRYSDRLTRKISKKKSKMINMCFVLNEKKNKNILSNKLLS